MKSISKSQLSIKLGDIPLGIKEEVIEKAIVLKKEQPGRSVEQIIRILELARVVRPRELSESTLSK